MASKKARRRWAKKKKTLVSFLTFLLVLALLLGIYYLVFVRNGKDPLGLFTPPAVHTPTSGEGSVISSSGTVQTNELSVHFLELGVKETGDCTLIKVGNTEVLIDAGAKQASADTIIPYINRYCTDGVLEYVIATHAHEDHIGAFYSTKERKGIFETYDCRTIIDFPKTNKEYSAASVYGRYTDARDAEVAGGAVHYTALECYNEQNGARRSYELDENTTLNILYQKYYEEEFKGDENNYSVCVLLTQGDYNYLFTGDLEEKGEQSLVESNALPHCEVYKGGHHGSSTSTTEALLAAITPDCICICACAGSPEHTTDPLGSFPTQECVDRMAKYTERIYVTSLAVNVDLVEEKWEYALLNGNIVVTSNGLRMTVACSHSDKILKDTEWFQQNRTWNSGA